MKICLVHNTYQLKGGEDVVLANETALLSEKNQVRTYLADNAAINSLRKSISTAVDLKYSRRQKSLFRNFLESHAFDIVHVHNLFPLLTPSIYDACAEKGVPVVQTLHNFRNICPGAYLLRDGRICEKCLAGSPYHAALHACYRNSHLGSLAVARMVDYHRRHQTWSKKVERFIALTQFGKKKFVDTGFPAKKIAVKPNFYPGPGLSAAEVNTGERRGALFVGRLSPEKGVHTLLQAWAGCDLPLRLAGVGPLAGEIMGNSSDKVQLLGQLTGEEVSREMRTAAFLVMPSQWYETFGMVIIEAFAHGLPVLAARLGAMAEIVADGVTGLHFEPGDPGDLAAKVRWLRDHPLETRRMGQAARREFERRYTPERNYDLLLNIYREAVDNRQRS